MCESDLIKVNRYRLFRNYFYLMIYKIFYNNYVFEFDEKY